MGYYLPCCNNLMRRLVIFYFVICWVAGVNFANIGAVRHRNVPAALRKASRQATNAQVICRLRLMLFILTISNVYFFFRVW